MSGMDQKQYISVPSSDSACIRAQLFIHTTFLRKDFGQKPVNQPIRMIYIGGFFLQNPYIGL